MGPQEKALDAGAEIIVGTPGRILDHIRRGNLDLVINPEFGSPAYFDVLGAPMIAGRSFAAADVVAGEGVAVVSETLAREYLPSADALVEEARRALEATSRSSAADTGDGAEDPWAGTAGIDSAQAVVEVEYLFDSNNFSDTSGNGRTGVPLPDGP